MRFFLLLIFLIGIFVIAGCAQTDKQEQTKEQPAEVYPPQPENKSPEYKSLVPSPPPEPPLPQPAPPFQPPGEGKQPVLGCDNICDAFEQQHHESPCYKPDCLGIKDEPQPIVQPPSQPPQQPLQLNQTLPVGPPTANPEDIVTVQKINSTYRILNVTKKPSGWFTTGQNADVMLSGIDFNNAGGPLLFNHPGVLASDGVRLLLPDRFNNRILIWNKLPTANTPPDLVLGQKDFISNNPGTGRDQMNWPVSVSVSPDGKLAVTDTMNARILLWKSFPTRNGQPADVILSGRQGGGQQRTDIVWPWGVWTNGQKLAVASTRGSALLVWNQFPTWDDQLPDFYVTAKDQFGTPRTITSDGKSLTVSDHNAKVSVPGVPASVGAVGSASITFFWKSFPTSDASYDFYMPGWMQGTFTKDKKLILLGDKLYIWNKFPENANDRADLAVGRTGPGGEGFYFEGGDGAGVIEINGSLYISLYNGNKIVVYNSIPTDENQKPDFAIGTPDIETNTLKTNYFMSNPQVATNGKNLFVVSDFDRKFYIWKNLPDESNAKPDFVYDFFGERGNVNFQALGIAAYGDTVAIAGRAANERPDVYIWTKPPLNGEMPDRHFTGKIGSVKLQKASGIAIDANYFYLSDELSNKIYIWKGIPNETVEPKFVLSNEAPTTISSDGKYLLVNSMGMQPRITLFEINRLSNGASGQALQGVAAASGKAHISKGHIFTTNTGNSQLRIWKTVENALSGANSDVILGEDDLEDEVSEIGRNKLFWPNSIAFDGSYLWVGEVKFSNRLLRFSVK